MLVGLFLALVPASGVQAQIVGPGYTVPPSMEYGPLSLTSSSGRSSRTERPSPISSHMARRKAWCGTMSWPVRRLISISRASSTPTSPAQHDRSHGEPGWGGETLATYVVSLWPVLTESFSSVPPYATLLPLPYPYVVPGGRFREVYYWDAYFTMLGLEQSGQHRLAVDMLKDFAFEIDRYAHVPNGNRSYYLSRSQPPFFALMVELMARHDGAAIYVTYLPELQAEYVWWMQGEKNVRPGRASRHVVKLADGTVLNRYWDERAAPRDESTRRTWRLRPHRTGRRRWSGGTCGRRPNWAGISARAGSAMAGPWQPCARWTCCRPTSTAYWRNSNGRSRGPIA